MRKQYHILNGDSLKEQFPENVEGEIIVSRECLVDGDIKGRNLTDLFQSRAHFISDNYEGFSVQDYYEKTVPEFQKIRNITDGADINLWFEDDLFCQVNLWFTINLLNQSSLNNLIFLIRPKTRSPYSFGDLNKAELSSVYKNRILLTELDQLAGLWTSYQNDNTESLLKTARELEEKYPFILPAVNAHIERIPSEGSLGRPGLALVQIMNDLKTEQFELIFKEFSKREPIYGFGDLQVKRLLDELKNIGQQEETT